MSLTFDALIDKMPLEKTFDDGTVVSFDLTDRLLLLSIEEPDGGDAAMAVMTFAEAAIMGQVLSLLAQLAEDLSEAGDE